MDSNEYQQLAMRTANNHQSVSGKDQRLINAALGLVGEGGEIADSIKKYAFQGHDLDKDHLIKELGDVLWYVALAATALDTNLSDIMAKNVAKLKSRYPDGFSVQASRERVD